MVEHLVELIRKYIALVDKLPELTASSFLSQCAILLPQIYFLAQQLPDVELLEEDLESDQGERIDSPISIIHQVLGKYDIYTKVYDPVYDTETLTGMLSDDLADIYIDLKQPLMKYDSKEEVNKKFAIWEWRFNIQTHCGNHLVDALCPIHRLVYDHLGRE